MTEPTWEQAPAEPAPNRKLFEPSTPGPDAGEPNCQADDQRSPKRHIPRSRTHEGRPL